MILCTLCVSHSIAKSIVDSDYTAAEPESLSWACVNNATCISAVSEDVMQRLRSRKPVQLGIISIDPVGHGVTSFMGRSMSFLDILNGNALKVPLGPMLLSVQRSIEYENYLEVALLRKSSDQGKYLIIFPSIKCRHRMNLLFSNKSNYKFKNLNQYIIYCFGL